MVEAGLTASEAIVAATSGSARALGIADRGIIEPGKAADLLILDGDPLADPSALSDATSVRLVIRDGIPVAGAALETMTKG
jgi:imidazolonepropionase-like amidohydrolase